MRHGRDWSARIGTPDVVALAGAVVAAVLCRAVIVANTPASAPVSDMAEYWTRGVYLFEHGALYPDSWRMPGLPVWLATVFTLSGGASVDAARLGNVAAAAVATALAYLVARRTGSCARALAAALVVALYPTLLLYSSLVATESLVAVPVLVVFLAATLPGIAGAMVLGGSVGAAILVRPASVALVPAALASVVFAPPPNLDQPRPTPDGAVPDAGL
ncbi:MAG: glycosyltransferase family 39 protein [Vicinamibacterales bacterium]